MANVFIHSKTLIREANIDNVSAVGEGNVHQGGACVCLGGRLDWGIDIIRREGGSS